MGWFGHTHVPARGKAEGKTTYHTGVFSIVPLREKALDMIQLITNFHRLKKKKKSTILRYIHYLYNGDMSLEIMKNLALLKPFNASPVNRFYN